MWAILYAIKRSWTQHFVAQFSGLTVMVLAYSAVIFIALSLTNLQSIFDSWGKISKVTVYLKKAKSKDSLVDLEAWFRRSKMISTFRLVSPEESSLNFKNRFAKISNQKLDANQLEQFFPPFYELSLNETKAYKGNAGDLDEFVATLQGTFGSVQSVSYGKQWLQRYTTVLSYIHRGGWFLILLFILASVIVSTSVIKTILYSKRDEIEILEFIGASEYSIYLPQVVSVMLVSFLSFVIALGANFLLFDILTKKSGDLVYSATLAGFRFVPLSLIFCILMLILVSAFLYSALTIYSLLPSRKKAMVVNEVVS